MLIIISYSKRLKQLLFIMQDHTHHCLLDGRDERMKNLVLKYSIDPLTCTNIWKFKKLGWMIRIFLNKWFQVTCHLWAT